MSTLLLEIGPVGKETALLISRRADQAGYSYLAAHSIQCARPGTTWQSIGPGITAASRSGILRRRGRGCDRVPQDLSVPSAQYRRSRPRVGTGVEYLSSIFGRIGVARFAARLVRPSAKWG